MDEERTGVQSVVSVICMYEFKRNTYQRFIRMYGFRHNAYQRVYRKLNNHKDMKVNDDLAMEGGSRRPPPPDVYHIVVCRTNVIVTDPLERNYKRVRICELQICEMIINESLVICKVSMIMTKKIDDYCVFKTNTFCPNSKF